MHTEEKNNKIKKRKADALIESIRLQSSCPGEEYSAERSFSRLMERINAIDRPADIFRLRARYYRKWLVAATVSLLIALSGWLYTALTPEAAPELIVQSNHTGLVQNVTLPDGTAIKLNNRSKLIYPERFSGKKREVFLEGEAYFDVEHDKKHPFVVHAGSLKIKVLGTKFTVNANSTLPQITATLLEGSIDVSNDKQSILMKPNQQLTYDIGQNSMKLADLTDTADEIRWTKNVWVLSGTPLLDICRRLEQLFDVKFIIMNDELINKSFTGEFYTNESLESILEIMRISTSLKYERRGKNIILK